ncbi:MAG: hypothetical protein LBG80_15200 [Bacteroidales bacterium]|jgi:hypothetical protein|nr:hypothetical protein [Bacteroidales bacterium]
MYTSYIGKKFLKLYNEREGKKLSAEEFFEKIQFPIFFDAKKHLMHVHNSTFHQKFSQKDVIGNKCESMVRLERLQKDIANEKISCSTYVGYAADKMTAVTSGQMSNLFRKIDKEEIYLSWIGEGLSIGVKGGLILFDEKDLLWHIFQGWNIYRKYLSQTPNIKEKQIEIWNGQFVYSTFQSTHKMEDYNPPVERDKEKDRFFIPTISWIKLLFVLSKVYPRKSFIGNAYILEKTNSTFGFIKIILPEIKKLYELRDILFINEPTTILSDKEIENLSTFYNFKTVCSLGTIGLKAIEPAKLREYMPKGSVMYAQGKDYKFSDEQSYSNYKLFKIWIMAMLNKTELLNLASNVAKALLKFEKMEERGKKVYSALSQDVRDANSLRVFINKLTEILERTPENAEIFKKVVEEGLKMPSDNYPLFVTLIRFEYVYWKLKSNN